MTTLILSVFFSISASAYDVEVDGIYYNLIEKAKQAKVVSGDNRYSGDINIPSSIVVDEIDYSVTAIEREAFNWCFNLISVTIPNSVTSIGDYAFSSCIGLTSVTIPNSVTSIGNNAFSSCSGLTSVTIPNSVTYIGCYAFLDCSGLTSVTIPNSVSSIESYVFLDCSGLTSVTIPNTITSIGTSSFSGCSSLTSITIPNTVTKIGTAAFKDCRSLTSITIPNSVTMIESSVFENCSNLDSITIGSGVKSIYDKSFAKCDHIETIKCLAKNIPSTNTDAFKDSYIEYATLHVPASAINAYKTTEPWSKFGTIKTIEGSEGETKKCETPTISFVSGELVYNCATEGVEYVSEIKSNDINKFYTDKVSLSACYDISVTAMKTGYDNSDVATAKLYWLPSSGTLEGDNINNVTMRGIAIQSAGGFINISGLDNNEKVSFYGIDGKALGSAKSIDGNVSFSAKQGTVVIAKIGNESVKIAVE